MFLKAIFQIEEVERIKKGRRIAVDYLAWRNEPRVNVNGYLFITHDKIENDVRS